MLKLGDRIRIITGGKGSGHALAKGSTAHYIEQATVPGWIIADGPPSREYEGMWAWAADMQRPVTQMLEPRDYEVLA